VEREEEEEEDAECDGHAEEARGLLDLIGKEFQFKNSDALKLTTQHDLY